MPDPIIVTTGGPLGGEFTLNRKTILNLIQEACPFIGLSVPSAVFSSTAREHIELQQIANEMAERIAFDTHDWTKLKVKATLTGDGTSESFFLPEDYRRMLKTSSLWPANNFHCPLYHEPDTDQWLAMETFGFPLATGAWTMIGEEIFIKPIVTNAAEIQFFYLTNLIVLDALDQFKTSFTSDDDAFVLDGRLLRLGIIWMWKQLKGFPFEEDLQTYEDALDRLSVDDKGPRVIRSGSRRVRFGTHMAWPGSLG
jgi:hypothetical protein